MGTYWLDMDLCLAKFIAEHGEMGDRRYRTQPGYFLTLKPYANIDAVNRAVKRRTNVYILSNSPTKQADIDKQAWLDIYLPNMPKKRRIYNRGHLTAEFTKAQVAARILGRPLNKDDILIDDSLRNLVEWTEAGGTAVLKKNRGVNVEWSGASVYRMTQIADLIAAV